MPHTDWVSINTSLVQTPPPPPDTPRTYAMVAPAVPAGITAKTTRYSTLSEMADDGWGTGFVAYNAMARLLQQEPTETAVSSVVVIRRETAVANIWTIDIVSTSDGDHKIYIDGVLAATYNAAAATATQIKDGLVSAFNLGPFATEIVAASVDPDTLSLTAQVAGIPFTPTTEVPGGTNHTVTETVASVGIYDDLDAAYKEAPFWGVMLPGALDVENDEGRRWVGADRVTRRNFLFADSADAGIYDSLDTDNLAVEWVTAQWPRVNLLSHPTATDYMQASMVGRLGGAFPGSRAWHYIEIIGSTETTVTANRTTAQTATMRARRVSYSERFFGPASDLMVVGGYTPDGFYIVQVHAEDWWWYTIRATIDFAMAANEGINLDDEGLQGVVDLVAQAMIPLVNNGVIDDTFTVTYTPPLDQIPLGELAIGDYKTSGKILASATITPKLRALRVDGEFALA